MYKRYSNVEEWSQIKEKTVNDFFNGIEAVRFDYDNSTAYVSVAFDDYSDFIFLRFFDSLNTTVIASYVGVSTFYDNRNSVITSSADDWNSQKNRDAQFIAACESSISARIWLSTGIITEYNNTPPPWESIQKQINLGYIEAAAHSRTHSYPSEQNYSPEFEISGSKEDMINNLDLPDRIAAHEYLYAWIEPRGQIESNLGGEEYSEIRKQLSKNKFLVDRSTQVGNQALSEWTYLGLYRRVAVSICADTNELDILNDSFDNVVENGGVYHFYYHPWQYDWKENIPNKIQMHLS